MRGCLTLLLCVTPGWGAGSCVGGCPGILLHPGVSGATPRDAGRYSPGFREGNQPAWREPPRASLLLDLWASSVVSHFFPLAATLWSFGCAPAPPWSIFVHGSLVVPAPGELLSCQPGPGASWGSACSCQDPRGKK